MQPACIRHTEIPHTSRLFTDFLYHFDRVAGFYPSGAQSVGRAAEGAASLNYPDDRRQALVGALRAQNGDSPQLELLARPGTVAVVTGQQVGLFGGPAYTVYKALTAARIAQDLNALGVDAVPVFWLATEDHDFAEVSRCWVFDGQYRPVSLDVVAPEPDHRPVGTIALDDPPVAGVRASLAEFPYGDAVCEAVASAYPRGGPMGGAFRRLMSELLEPYGLLFLDPLAHEIRELSAPLLTEAARNAGQLNAALTERNQHLEGAGYHAQVHVEAETSLLFLLDEGHRIPVHRNGDGFEAAKIRISLTDLVSRAHSLSPNALLRPVLQDYLLPTAAYVGGPAELAYLAQAEVIYSRLLGRMPVVFSRAGFTIIDARSAKLCAKYGLNLPSLYEGEDAIRSHISAKLVPPDLENLQNKATESVERWVADLESATAAFDPTLGAAAATSGRKIRHHLAKIRAKTARESLRRDARAASDAAYLAALFSPHGHLQERFYSILPFLAMHGPDLVGKLYEAIHTDCPDHHVLYV